MHGWAASCHEPSWGIAYLEFLEYHACCHQSEYPNRNKGDDIDAAFAASRECFGGGGGGAEILAERSMGLLGEALCVLLHSAGCPALWLGVANAGSAG